MQTEGFQLAFLEVDNQVVAVSGYRIYTNLHLGKHCYVDDLVTASEHRSKGYGDQLLAWVRNQAKEAGCTVLHLDSATYRTRAHKFYFERGFTISSFHFTEELVWGVKVRLKQGAKLTSKTKEQNKCIGHYWLLQFYL